jgi:hypothetical protein
MLVPKAVLIDADSAIRWSNPSNLPHNVFGTFNQTTASDAITLQVWSLRIRLTIIAVLLIMTMDERQMQSQ